MQSPGCTWCPQSWLYNENFASVTTPLHSLPPPLLTTNLISEKILSEGVSQSLKNRMRDWHDATFPGIGPVLLGHLYLLNVHTFCDDCQGSKIVLTVFSQASKGDRAEV